MTLRPTANMTSSCIQVVETWSAPRELADFPAAASARSSVRRSSAASPSLPGRGGVDCAVRSGQREAQLRHRSAGGHAVG
jgi:hypothetical protein